MDKNELNSKVNDAYEKLMSINPEGEDNKITDEQVEEVLEAIRSIKDPIADEIANYPSNRGILERPVGSAEDIDIPESKVMTLQDPITGRFKVTGDMSEYNESDSKSFDDILDTESFSKNKIAIDPVLLYNKIRDLYKLPVEESQELANMVVRYNNDKTDLPIFSELPKLIKDIINSQCVANNIINKGARNDIIKMLLDNIIEDYDSENNNIDIDKILDEYNKQLAQSDPELRKIAVDTFNEYNIAAYKHKKHGLYEMAEKVKDTDPEKAANIIKVAESYTEAEELNLFKESIKDKKIKIRKIDLEKYNKVFKRFNYRYENSKLNIYDISSCPHVLDRHLDKEKYSTDDIVKLCVYFCKYCDNMSPDNIFEHMFMYYFVYNIVTLDFTGSPDADEESKEFYNRVIDNLSACIDLLNNR